MEPAFASGRPFWPLAGGDLADFEPDEPDLAIPRGALRLGMRDAPEILLPEKNDPSITQAVVEPLGPEPAKAAPFSLKWKLALAASCIFHVALALFFIQATDDVVQIEGAEYSGQAALGNAADDQISAGDVADQSAVEVTMITMLEAKPVETVDAEAVEVERATQLVERAEPAEDAREVLQPVAEPEAQQVDIASAEPVEAAPASAAEPPATADPVEADVSPILTGDVVPEVLATDRPLPPEDHNTVPAPLKTETAKTERVELQATEAAKSAEAVETAREADKVVEQAAAAKSPETDRVQPESEKVARNEPVVEEAPDATPPRKPAKAPRPAEKKSAVDKVAEKQPEPKSKKAETKVTDKPSDRQQKQSGNRGRNQSDAVRGKADGNAGAGAVSKGGKNSAAGNAAISNYPGKIASKLKRALRYPAEAKKQKLRGTVQVAFVVSASGGVSSIRVVSSSGSPVLDKAALDTVRRAAPFPAIPAGAGRSSWPFSVPLAFNR